MGCYVVAQGRRLGMYRSGYQCRGNRYPQLTDLVCGVTIRNDPVGSDDNTVNIVVLEQASQHRIAYVIS
jgi:hypothetical protein